MALTKITQKPSVLRNLRGVWSVERLFPAYLVAHECPPPWKGGQLEFRGDTAAEVSLHLVGNNDLVGTAVLSCDRESIDRWLESKGFNPTDNYSNRLTADGRLTFGFHAPITPSGDLSVALAVQHIDERSGIAVLTMRVTGTPRDWVQVWSAQLIKISAE